MFAEEFDMVFSVTLRSLKKNYGPAAEQNMKQREVWFMHSILRIKIKSTSTEYSIQ
jgi:hypothetical protein